METAGRENDTYKNAIIRAERQRERAEKWRARAEAAQVYVTRADDLCETYMELENLYIELRKQETRHEFDYQKLKRRKDRYARALAEKRDECDRLHRTAEKALRQIERDERATRIGYAQMKKNRELRILKKIDSLIHVQWYNDGEPVTWLRRALKRYVGAASNVPVEVVGGAARLRLIGQGGYHTTPSGKTVVTYPNAYKWRTVYHCSTERVIVGRVWVAKNIKKLARSHAEMVIK